MTAENKLKANNKGFIALITVLIVLAIALTVGLGLGLLSISEAQMSLQKNQSSQAYYLANLCGEDALMELKNDEDYTGVSGWIDVENGSCNILVEDTGVTWIVKVTATFFNQTKKIKIVVGDINPVMNINSWQEVASF